MHAPKHGQDDSLFLLYVSLAPLSPLLSASSNPISSSPYPAMSSKRGRKRNDNLPPNRARDVQRAFRARRAAHLQVGRSPTSYPLIFKFYFKALEQRVNELETENEALRTALNLPPANRPSLGKGPTGKDKVKAPHDRSGSSGAMPSLPSMSHNSPSDSPSSSRTHSLSPTNSMAVPASQLRKSPPSLPSLDSSAWDHPMMITKEGSGGTHASPASTAYSLTPISGPSTGQSHLPSFTFSDPMPSRNQPGMFLPPGTQNISHAERPRDYSDSDFTIRDHRDDRHHYSYSQPSFSSHEQASLHSPHESAMNTISLSHRDSMGSPSSQSFAHRRSITEPQGFRGIMNQQYPHLPNPQPHTQQATAYPSIRLPTPPKVSEPGRSGYGISSSDRRMLQ